MFGCGYDLFSICIHVVDVFCEDLMEIICTCDVRYLCYLIDSCFLFFHETDDWGDIVKLDEMTSDGEDEVVPNTGPDEVTPAFKKLEVEYIEEFEDLEIDGYPNDGYTKMRIAKEPSRLSSILPDQTTRIHHLESDNKSFEPSSLVFALNSKLASLQGLVSWTRSSAWMRT